LTYKALVNGKDDDGWTPLHYAALKGHKNVVELLLTNNAEINPKTNDGLTPLHCAASGGWDGNKEVAELLLANKAEVNAKDNNGLTPLHCAAGGGHKDVVDVLLANKAEVNAKDNNGNTPLHDAVMNPFKLPNGNTEIIDCLRQRGGHESTTEIDRLTFINRATFSMSLPDKWTENTTSDNYNSNSFIFFEGPEQVHFFVMIGKKSAGASVETLLNAQRDELSKKFTDAMITKTTKWSGFDGQGLRIEGKIMGILSARLTIFGFEKVDNVCLIEEYSSLRAYNICSNDFEKIRQTFKIK
jgi:hypothetical protein